MSEMGLLGLEVVETEMPFLTGTDKTAAVSSASGWFSNNLGQLNNLIFTSYDGEDPALKNEEEAIYKCLYLSSYYKTRAASVLRNMDSTTIEWLSLREGDSSVQLQNKNEVAKTFLLLSREKQAEIASLVTAYNLYQARPSDVYVASCYATGYCA
jgi:hypothetical protein